MASATVNVTAPSDIPTTEELVARTRELIPLMRERAPADEANRKVDPDTVRRMNEAGLFRVLQPKRGHECQQSNI